MNIAYEIYTFFGGEGLTWPYENPVRLSQTTFLATKILKDVPHCQGKLSSPQNHQNSSYSWRFPVFNLGMPLDMSVSSNQWQMKIYSDFQSWKQNMISLMTSLAISASWSIRKKGSLPLFSVAVFGYSIPFAGHVGMKSLATWIFYDSKVEPPEIFPDINGVFIHGVPL